MKFYTVFFSQSANYWVALCLENGIVAQGTTQENAIKQLKEAIDSFQEVYQSENNIYLAPVSIEDLHEFLIVEGKSPTDETYELRAIYA